MGARFLICTFAIFLVLTLGPAGRKVSAQSQNAVIDRSKVDFGDRDIGAKSKPEPLTVTNKTNSKLKFSVRIDNSNEYQIDSNGCYQDVSAQASCNISVVFLPNGLDKRQGTLSIEYQSENDAQKRTIAVDLQGKGLLPELGISSMRIGFPAQKISDVSASQPVILRNDSQKDLTITGIVVAGDFLLGGLTFPQTLKQGESLIALVSFAPKQEGDATGMLTIQSTSHGSPQEVYLHGSGLGIAGGLCSAGERGEIGLMVALCLAYWLAMVIVRWNRVARPTRELLKAQIKSLEVEFDTVVTTQQITGPGPASIRQLLVAATDLIGPEGKWNFGIADFLFWSRGQEITGWGYVHETEIQMAQFLPEATVTARLEAVEQRLRVSNDNVSVALAGTIHQGLTTEPLALLDRRRALLAEALSAKYGREDNNYADLVSWQNKTSWLIGCGLFAAIALTVAVRHHSILFLVGGAGGLLSRMSRSLDRKDVPTDYGASWTTLFLSPVAGALGAWAGILLSGLAANIGVLGSNFRADWDNPCQPLTLAIALIFGFSERLLDSVLDNLTEKSGSAQSPVTTPPLVPKPSEGATKSSPVLTITTDSKLIDGRVGDDYTARLESLGGTGKVTWALQEGSSLPRDLQMGSDGKITGKPAFSGDFSFTMVASDQTSKQSKLFKITINPKA
ncbi:MAG TPA: choice-of-anchor D domain-containing protein [Candidatus Acidoferrum sp.]|nr:choice-of-anchor D domain-containing protein [Candidatus Acidoferrum sp.]